MGSRLGLAESKEHGVESWIIGCFSWLSSEWRNYELRSLSFELKWQRARGGGLGVGGVGALLSFLRNDVIMNWEASL